MFKLKLYNIVAIFSTIFFLCPCFLKAQEEQGIYSKPFNFTSFTNKKAPEKADFIEVMDKRTIDGSYYISIKDPSVFATEKATGPIHYLKDGRWATINTFLQPKTANLFEASEQQEPVGFDINQKKAYIRTVEGDVYFNSWQLTGANDAGEMLLANANWSNYTAGDDGIHIINIFPGIDAEMKVLKGSIKTSFIITKNYFPGYSKYIFKDVFNIDKSLGRLQTVQNKMAEADFVVGNKKLLHIGKNFMYAASAPEQSFQNLSYNINADQLSFSVNADYLNKYLQSGKIIIDPIVTADQTTQAANILASKNNGAYNNACNYPVNVTIPALSTCTNVYLKFGLYVNSPVITSQAFFGLVSDTCGVFFACSPQAGGDCTQSGTVGTIGGFATISKFMLPCLPPPACAQQTISWQLRLWNTYKGGTSGICDATYVGANEPLIIRIEGRTVEVGTINSLPNTSACAGSSVNLSAAGAFGVPPYTYSWNNNAGNSSAVTVNPVSTTTYTVTVTDKCSNTSTASVNVNVGSGPGVASPTASNNGPLCENGVVKLTASTVAGATYQWTGPNGYSSTSQTPTFNGATAPMSGKYSVVAKINNCNSLPATTDVVITATPVVQSVDFNYPVCTDSVLKLSTPDIPGATYQWSGPNSFTSTSRTPQINNVNNANAGLYSVVATVNNCPSASMQKNILVFDAPPTPQLGSNAPVCEGDNITLTATTVAGASYQWTGPNGYSNLTDQNPTILKVTLASAGVYTLVETNVCRSAPATINVNLKPSPVIDTIFGNQLHCLGQTLSLTVNDIPGASFKWTIWDGITTFTSDQQNLSIPSTYENSPSGHYSVTATLNNCTSIPKTVFVQYNETPLMISAGNNGPVCEGDAIELNTPLVDADLDYKWKWSGPNGFTSTEQNPKINTAIAANEGVYSVSAFYHSCPSKDTLTTTVIVKPTPVVAKITSNSPLCNNQPLSLAVPDISGASFNWTGPNGFTSSNQNLSIQNVTDAQAGAYIVTATFGSPGSQCVSDPVSTIVAVGVLPQAGFKSTPICLPNTNAVFTDTSTISAGNIVSYQWNFGDAASGNNNTATSISPEHTFTTVQPFTVTLIVKSDKGCVATATDTYNKFLNQPKADFSIIDATVCVNDSVTFINASSTAEGILDKMTWSFGDGNTIEQADISQPLQHNYTAPGKYNTKLTVVNSAGCKDDSVQVVDVSPLPVINAGDDKYIFENESKKLLITGESSDLTYQWSPADFLNNTTIAEPTVSHITNDVLYKLKVTSAGGCSATDSVYVKLLKLFDVPNTFTPNGDGINETWVIKNLTLYPKVRVEVFDRYGQLLYQSNGQYKPWDGTYKGKPVPMGTYYYIIDTDGFTSPFTGYVTIIK